MYPAQDLPYWIPGTPIPVDGHKGKGRRLDSGTDTDTEPTVSQPANPASITSSPTTILGTPIAIDTEVNRDISYGDASRPNSSVFNPQFELRSQTAIKRKDSHPTSPTESRFHESISSSSSSASTRDYCVPGPSIDTAKRGSMTSVSSHATQTSIKARDSIPRGLKHKKSISFSDGPSEVHLIRPFWTEFEVARPILPEVDTPPGESSLQPTASSVTVPESNPPPPSSREQSHVQYDPPPVPKKYQPYIPRSLRMTSINTTGKHGKSRSGKGNRLVQVQGQYEILEREREERLRTGSLIQMPAIEEGVVQSIVTIPSSPLQIEDPPTAEHVNASPSNSVTAPEQTSQTSVDHSTRERSVGELPKPSNSDRRIEPIAPWDAGRSRREVAPVSTSAIHKLSAIGEIGSRKHVGCRSLTASEKSTLDKFTSSMKRPVKYVWNSLKGALTGQDVLRILDSTRSDRQFLLPDNDDHDNTRFVEDINNSQRDLGFVEPTHAAGPLSNRPAERKASSVPRNVNKARAPVQGTRSQPTRVGRRAGGILKLAREPPRIDWSQLPGVRTPSLNVRVDGEGHVESQGEANDKAGTSPPPPYDELILTEGIAVPSRELADSVNDPGPGREIASVPARAPIIEAELSGRLASKTAQDCSDTENSVSPLSLDPQADEMTSNGKSAVLPDPLTYTIGSRRSNRDSLSAVVIPPDNPDPNRANQVGRRISTSLSSHRKESRRSTSIANGYVASCQRQGDPRWLRDGAVSGEWARIMKKFRKGEKSRR